MSPKLSKATIVWLLVAVALISVEGQQSYIPPSVVGGTPSAPVACTSPTVTNANGTAAFLIDVGTSCAGISTLSVTMPAATNGWNCNADSLTAPATSNPEQSATTTSSVTVTNYVRTTGVAGAWADGADISISCFGR